MTDVDAGPNGTGPVMYLGDRTQSPIDAALARHLQDIAARGTGRADVFMKLGDSITSCGAGVAGSFLNCFDGVLEGTTTFDINVHLDRFCALAPTVEYFKAGRLPARDAGPGSDGGEYDAWSRDSLAAKVGMGADWAIADAGGLPSPLAQEFAVARPRFAVVMFGSNDIGFYGDGEYPVVAQAEAYERSMRALTDQLLARGVVPLLTTMPPRTSSATYLRYVPVYTGVVRAIAQGRQVPLIDFNRELMALGAPYGLGPDGIHPTQPSYNMACDFSAASLAQHGYNVRNLVTLTALDRVRRVFQSDAGAPDPSARRLVGSGTSADPFVIPSVPFGELRDLRAVQEKASGPWCHGAAPAGPRSLYRLSLGQPAALRILLLDGGPRALQVSLWSGETCLAADASLVAKSLAAGTYSIAVAAPTAASASEYNLSVTACIAGDPGCP